MSRGGRWFGVLVLTLGVALSRGYYGSNGPSRLDTFFEESPIIVVAVPTKLESPPPEMGPTNTVLVVRAVIKGEVTEKWLPLPGMLAASVWEEQGGAVALAEPINLPTYRFELGKLHIMALRKGKRGGLFVTNRQSVKVIPEEAVVAYQKAFASWEIEKQELLAKPVGQLAWLVEQCRDDWLRPAAGVGLVRRSMYEDREVYTSGLEASDLVVISNAVYRAKGPAEGDGEWKRFFEQDRAAVVKILVDRMKAIAAKGQSSSRFSLEQERMGEVMNDLLRLVGDRREVVRGKRDYMTRVEVERFVEAVENLAAKNGILKLND